MACFFNCVFSDWQSTPARGGKWRDGNKHEQTESPDRETG